MSVGHRESALKQTAGLNSDSDFMNPHELFVKSYLFLQLRPHTVLGLATRPLLEFNYV